ncbi:MAG: hypothetical protein ABSB78_02975 [Bacteroidota bacterium]
MAAQDAQEELEFVKKVIAESRKTIIQDGADFLRWGILASLGIFASYFYNYFNWQMTHVWIFWAAIVVIGWTFSIQSYIRVRKIKSTSFTGKIIWSTWIGCGIALTILGFVGPLSGAYSAVLITAVTSAVMGIGYYANGILIGSRWYIFFAICWWCGSIALFFLHRIESLLIFGLMMVFFQVIPGYIFVRQRKKDVVAA